MCNTNIAGSMPVYVVSQTPKPDFTETITKQEYNVLRRMRQLRNEGGRIAVIELSEKGPKVCKVGKAEG